MNRKLAFLMILPILVMGVLTLVMKTQRVEASGTIYIRADGNIDPPTANITTVDKTTYTFIGNINDTINVQRDNIVIDGAGYTIYQVLFEENGIILTNRLNITIKNTKVVGFSQKGIYLKNSSAITLSRNVIRTPTLGIVLYQSSNNIISDNCITNNDYAIKIDIFSYNNIIFNNNITKSGNVGILLFSDNNTISENNITNNKNGVRMDSSHRNTITGNNITGNDNIGISLSECFNNTISNNRIDSHLHGVMFEFSANNTIQGNNITNNKWYGIWLYHSSNNSFYHNNFVNNGQHVLDWVPTPSELSINLWDNGFPSGGNYWSDYEERYPNATELDGSGIWNTPYVINEKNQDNYPIVPEVAPFLVLPLFMTVTLLVAIVYRRKSKIAQMRTYKTRL